MCTSYVISQQHNCPCRATSSVPHPRLRAHSWAHRADGDAFGQQRKRSEPQGTFRLHYRLRGQARRDGTDCTHVGHQDEGMNQSGGRSWMLRLLASSASSLAAGRIRLIMRPRPSRSVACIADLHVCECILILCRCTYVLRMYSRVCYACTYLRVCVAHGLTRIQTKTLPWGCLTTGMGGEQGTHRGGSVTTVAQRCPARGILRGWALHECRHVQCRFLPASVWPRGDGDADNGASNVGRCVRR